MKSRGIQQHDFFKLGKGPAAKDKRNLKLRAVLLPVPAKLPDAYDYDVDGAGQAFPMQMFGNDQFGDCVIAERANQTMRFEFAEQKKILTIPDKIAVNEYFRETGGRSHDDGLVIADSLTLWRKKGWRIGGHTYKIDAYAEIQRDNYDEVRRAIIANIGANIGISLPLTAQDQIDAGQPWGYTGGAGSQPNSWGGHCVLVCGYNKIGPVCVTWARKQQMTWAFWDHYVDEAFSVFDRLNRFRKVIDVPAVKQFLGGVAKAA